MHAAFAHDTYYSRAPDGAVYSFGAFPSSLWTERFLPHFESLTVIGREKTFESIHAQTAIRSDHPQVRFQLLPSISSASGLILNRAKVVKIINAEVGGSDAVIVRGPTEFGMIATKAAKRAARSKLTSVNKNVAVEMSGCAFDHTWYHKSLTGKIYAPVKYLRARRMVKNADAVCYVTETFLQSRYPTNGTSANASNIEIDAPSSAVLQQRLHRIESTTPLLSFGLIGNHGNNLKGLDIACAALGRVQSQLPPFELRVLGHGPQISKYPFVHFDQPLNDKNDVLNWLDNIDIYLQPSRHEGLPRALIEALSRGCPALASNAGGTPELLAPECIHRRGNIKQLSIQILQALNPEWQKRQAIRNFSTAKNYTRDVLIPRREEFWRNFASKLPDQAQHKDVLVKIR
jgi:glycosyltransferase involved in cell wall biosynthesis